MPIWLRKLTYTRIRDAKEEEAEAYKNAGNKSKGKGRNKSTTNIDLANMADKKKMPKRPHYVSKSSMKKR
jgi:hypothetical protein